MTPNPGFDPNRSPPDGAHPSDYRLLQFSRNELEPSLRSALARHFEECPDCRLRRTQMSAQRDSFWQEPRAQAILEHLTHPAPQPSVEPQAQKGERPRRHLLVWATGLAAAAGMVALGWFLIGTGDRIPSNPVRSKGTEVTWVVQRGDRQTVAGPHFVFAAGDRIGFEVNSSIPLFATLLAVNAEGQARLLFPDSGELPMAIQANQKTVLPLGLQLIPPIGPERIFLLLTPERHDPEGFRQLVSSEMARLSEEGKGLVELTQLPVNGTLESRWVEIRR